MNMGCLVGLFGVWTLRVVYMCNGTQDKVLANGTDVSRAG